MKIILFGFVFLMCVVGCTTNEDPLICHVYGQVISEDDSITAIDGIILRIQDINPDNVGQVRIRSNIDTTETADSLGGFFEIDTVCYGTTSQQGTGYVVIYADSTSNPGYPSQAWAPTIRGDVDTIILYIY